MVVNSEDASNKIPLKNASNFDDEEKNDGSDPYHGSEAAAEARREQMRVNILIWMKKLTIILIFLIGAIMIGYIIFNLCFPAQLNHRSNNGTKSMPGIVMNGRWIGNSTASAGVLSDKLPERTGIDILEPIQALPVDMTSKSLPALTTHQQKNAKFVSKMGVYEKAAVCSDRDICSKIGSDILEQGGSAVDSAIASLLCNGITTMQSMGIGGGHLMNVFIKSENRAFTIDAREVASFAATSDIFTDANSNASTLHGGMAIAVPGEVMGYYRAYEKFGKLPWKKLVEPAIAVCKDGFMMSEHQLTSLKYKLRMVNNTALKSVFVNDTTGEIYPIGTIIKPRRELCETYEILMEKGPLDFYNGTLARLIAADLKDLGSTVTYGDLEAYNADLVNSISMPLGKDILYAVPPIGSGTIVAHILGILEGYNMTKVDKSDVEHLAKTYHRMAEAMKFGFAKRWELGDLRFVDVRELVSKLTSPDITHAVRLQINDSHSLKTVSDYGAKFAGSDDMGTSHVSVLAPNGDAVSVTSSINDYFGAGHIGKRTGIIFNSCIDDFSLPDRSNLFGLPPSPTNYIEPQKRPMSSMSPMILADKHGNVRIIIGAAGGSQIISSVAEIMARVLWFDENIKEAIDAERIHHQLLPNVLKYSADMNKEILIRLEAMGHKVKPIHGIGAAVCGIVKNETAIYANADYRKKGDVHGF